MRPAPAHAAPDAPARDAPNVFRRPPRLGSARRRRRSAWAERRDARARRRGWADRVRVRQSGGNVSSRTRNGKRFRATGMRPLPPRAPPLRPSFPRRREYRIHQTGAQARIHLSIERHLQRLRCLFKRHSHNMTEERRGWTMAGMGKAVDAGQGWATSRKGGTAARGGILAGPAERMMDNDADATYPPPNFSPGFRHEGACPALGGAARACAISRGGPRRSRRLQGYG